MKRTLLTLIQLTMLASSVPLMAAEPNQEKQAWQIRLEQIVQSRNAQKVAAVSLAGAAIAGAAYKYQDQIVGKAQKLQDIASAYLTEPVAETFEEVQARAKARYAQEKEASITRGTVVKTLLAGVTLLLGKKLYDKADQMHLLDGTNEIKIKELPGSIWGYMKNKYNQGVGYFTAAPTEQKVAMGVSAAVVAGLAGYAGYKVYKAVKSSSDVEDRITMIKNSLTKLQLSLMKKANIAVDELFILAHERPVVLFTTNEFYSLLEESQKKLVGQAIAQEATENALNKN